MAYQPIDFQRVAADLLADVRGNLESWFPAGKFRGNEFKVGNLSGEPGESLSVNLTTGAWADFADDSARGGDLLSLYAAKRGLGQLEAARELTGTPAPAPRANGHAGPPRLAPPVPAPFLRPPADAALPDCHHAKHGTPSAIYPYHDPDGLLFVVARYDPADPTQGRKQFCPWTWDGSTWKPKAPPAPRPLFNLDELARRSGDKVLLVEGEKAALAAGRLLRGYVVVTWPGGAGAVGHADWRPLAGREVDMWPDADRAGMKAMAAAGHALLELGATMRLINPTDVAEGWDAADAEAAGQSEQEVILWARARITDYTDGGPPPEKRPKTTATTPVRQPPVLTLVQSGEPDESSPYHHWQRLALDCNAGGMPYPHQANLRSVLLGHPDWAGRLYRDLFRQRTMYQPATATVREWRDEDDNALTCWFQQQLRMPKVTEATVARAVEAAAMANSRNPLTEWLEGLQWDQEPRLEHWLTDAMGVARTAYTAAVGANWLVSMVARAYRPGCQVDTMPVLEGKMGRGKSSALRVLGGDFYASTTDPFGGKDFLQTIVGVWLVEIPDLAGFTKRDHGHIIATVTQLTDRYRASYGRRAGDYPRTCILTATAETDDYLADSRGIRRFWPLRCGEVGDIDLDWLTANRDALFAEAVSLYRGGAKWWDVPEDEARHEQETRRDSDVWTEKVLAYADRIGDVQVSEVLTHCIEMPLGIQDQRAKNRVVSILRAAGFRCTVTTSRDRRKVRVWRQAEKA